MAGFSYQIVRGRGGWYENRARYFGGQLNKRQDGAICQVMTAVVNDAHLVSESGMGEPWHGFPWLTPVVGSGCLEIGSSHEINPDLARDAAAHAVSQLLDGLVGGEGLSATHNLPGLVAEFVHGLVVDRMSSDETISREEPSVIAPEIDEARARVLLIATLLNRTYFLAKVLADSPIPRWYSDTVSLKPTENNPELVRELNVLRKLSRFHIDELLEQADDLSTSLGKDVGSAIPDAIRDLIESVRTEVGRSQLRFSHLKLVTEVAWYLLTLGTALYPGWTDLLFKLMLGDGYQTTASTTRPAFSTLAGVGTKVAELYRRPSELSWQAWYQGHRAGDRTRRQDFYLAIAEMLGRQAAVRSSGLRAKLPLASAFSAGFDIELEMALMTAIEPGESYYVVVPVQVLPEDNSDHAKLCWLRARFQRPRALADDLSILLEPEEWDLVHPNLEVGMDRPHIVHLSGCPLLPLPSLGGAHGTVLEDISRSMRDGHFLFAPDRIVLEHAVTIDEYLALQQAEAELLWSVAQESGGSSREPSGRSLALPPLMLSSSAKKGGEGHCPRFWMTLGVPVADPAIRSRIVTQLSLKMLLEKTQNGSAVISDDDEDDEEQIRKPSTGTPKGPRSLAGMVVNRRINEEEGGILYWLGLDVVNDYAECFVDDVRHYTLHLDPGRGDQKISTHGDCRV